MNLMCKITPWCFLFFCILLSILSFQQDIVTVIIESCLSCIGAFIWGSNWELNKQIFKMKKEINDESL